MASTIWADADALPGVIREILIRAAKRTERSLIMVANKRLRVQENFLLKMIVVPGGPDVADQYIVDHMEAGDLVITADIPLAGFVVEKGGLALNPRGELYDEHNIGERLAMRNFMHDMREDGFMGGGPPPFDNKAKAEFANSLDRVLAKLNSQGLS